MCPILCAETAQRREDLAGLVCRRFRDPRRSEDVVRFYGRVHHLNERDRKRVHVDGGTVPVRERV